MFAPLPMRKLNVFVSRPDIEATIIALGRLEHFELSPGRSEDWSAGAPHWEELTDAYADLQRRAAGLLEALDLEPSHAVPPPALDPAGDRRELDDALAAIEEEVAGWQQRLQRADDEIERRRQLLAEMRLLTSLEVPVRAVRAPTRIHVAVGTMPRENLENLEVVLFRIPFAIVPVSVEDERALIVAATTRRHAALLDRALAGLFFRRVELPDDVNDVPAEVARTLEGQLANARERRARLLERRERLARRHGQRLLGLHRLVDSNRRVVQAVTALDRRGDVFLVSGWAPEHAVDETVIRLQNATGGRVDIQVVEPMPGDRRRVPTRLRNTGGLRDFESIVTTFGQPDYGELDPTPVVAVTYPLMFGMMFGDVGHGALLAILGFWLRGRAGGTRRALGGVLATVGLVAAAFGAVYGSVFGREDLLPALWVSPLDGIMDLLIASVAGGVVLINAGFVLHLVNAARRGDWGALLVSKHGVAGVALYWALLGGGYAAWRGALPVPAVLVLVAVPALVLLLEAPLRRLLAGKPAFGEEGGRFVESFFALFEMLISVVSNTLSFVRLGAFAVAHAGIMHVVFLLAERSPPVGAWLIVLVGTAIVIGLEGLVVGIQALRLEFYEFFGKFFQGDGRPFRPLRLFEARGS